MIYRNIKTGAEIITESVIVSPDWCPGTEKVAPKEAPKEPPKEELPKEEPPKVEKKSAPKKAVPKKKGSRK